MVFFLNYLLFYSSKQCNSFKTRAIQVKEGLEKSVAGITVLVNPDKVCLVNFINFAHSFSSWVELGILLTIKPLDIMR
jgi:hypothetical protein